MNTANNNQIEPRLPYNYAKIRVSSGLCVTCATYSYEIINEAYISVPRSSNDYIGKYYNQADGHWYADATFTVACPELDW